jgi:nickel-dependent lactate racemase
MATYACREGGSIILVAECTEGLGRADFINWFDAADSHALAARLKESYAVNGQTAWTLLAKTERFDVHLVSQLPDEQVTKMRMKPARTIEEALAKIDARADGYVMPRGAHFMPVVAADTGRA